MDGRIVQIRGLIDAYVNVFECKILLHFFLPRNKVIKGITSSATVVADRDGYVRADM